MALAFVALPVGLVNAGGGETTHSRTRHSYSQEATSVSGSSTQRGHAYERTPPQLRISLLNSSCINSVEDIYEKMNTIDILA